MDIHRLFKHRPTSPVGKPANAPGPAWPIFDHGLETLAAQGLQHLIHIFVGFTSTPTVDSPVQRRAGYTDIVSHRPVAMSDTSPQPPLPHPRARWRQLLRYTCGFAVLGPLMGSCLIALLMCAARIAEDGWNALLVLPALPVLAMVAQVIGLVPAALTGLLYGWLRPHLQRTWQANLLAAGCGALALAGCVLLVASRQADLLDQLAMRYWSSYALAGVFGALSALLSRCLAVAVRTRWQAHYLSREQPQAPD